MWADVVGKALKIYEAKQLSCGQFHEVCIRLVKSNFTMSTPRSGSPDQTVCSHEMFFFFVWSSHHGAARQRRYGGAGEGGNNREPYTFVFEGESLEEPWRARWISDDLEACPQPKRPALPSSDNPEKPVFGKPSYDGVIAGRVSGRNWKEPRKHRASASKVSVKGLPVEQRMKQKEIKKAYQERMKELKEEIRSNKVEKRKKREEREKKKQENILRSGTKLQKITNPKTLKKIAKSKQKKLLKVVPDDFIKK
ncbi:hypothetical protein NE237_001654 [Protea cynaroides]|uniref:Coiled-coil domain-containing protein 86 n=1 Tax=Protea cynaroides TaxID=273540 RepID=A0A9Q0KTI7_9MAGN|nr:hypothetical protein NE237_001654 [Protea cynaroides]